MDPRHDLADFGGVRVGAFRDFCERFTKGFRPNESRCWLWRSKCSWWRSMKIEHDSYLCLWWLMGGTGASEKFDFTKVLKLLHHRHRHWSSSRTMSAARGMTLLNGGDWHVCKSWCCPNQSAQNPFGSTRFFLFFNIFIEIALCLAPGSGAPL